MSRRRSASVSARIYHPEAQQACSPSLCNTLNSRSPIGSCRADDGPDDSGVCSDGVVNRSSFRLSDADFLDGLIPQGGADVSPQCYGEVRASGLGGRPPPGYPMRWNCCMNSWNAAGRYWHLPGRTADQCRTGRRPPAGHLDPDSWRFDSPARRLRSPSMTLNGTKTPRWQWLYPEQRRGGRCPFTRPSAPSARGLMVEARGVNDGVIEAVRLEGAKRRVWRSVAPRFHPPGAPVC